MGQKTMDRKQFEQKKDFNKIKTELYNIYKTNPDTAFTLKDIRKILEEKGIKPERKILAYLHWKWKILGITLHKRPHYIINLKSKEEP